MPKQMNIRPPEKLRQALKEVAQEAEMTVNRLIINILMEWLEKTMQRKSA